MMTPEQLETIGCKTIHWNPKFNGGFFEYYVPTSGNGLEPRDSRLSVTFNGMEKPTHDFMAWLVSPGARIGLRGVRTVEQFCMMYELLTGDTIEEKWPK